MFSRAGDEKTENTTQIQNVAIIGLGWYGAQCALHLAQNDQYKITVFEQNSSPFGGISGTFGVRLHIGPHYPRSQETRENCREGRLEFQATYPELVNEHSHSIYGVGKSDVEGKPSKVSSEQFKNICYETPTQQLSEIDILSSEFTENLESAFDIPEEASLALGNRLKKYFNARLRCSSVEIKYNYDVSRIIPKDEKYQIIATSTENHHFTMQSVFWFDRVINATSFKAHIPRSLPEPLKIIYQVCLALVYEALNPPEKPKSFIAMDGLFPCVMPYDIREDDTTKINYYILTHAKYTNVMTANNLHDAENFLKYEVPALMPEVHRQSEADILRFWPGFSSEFKYIGYRGVVLVKPAAETEFRSAITFEENGVIHIVPGKVSDIFHVAREVETLLSNNPSLINCDGEFCYVKGGVLDKGKPELSLPLSGDRNTSGLQTHMELRTTPIQPIIFHEIAPLTTSSAFFDSNPRSSLDSTISKLVTASLDA